MRAKHPKARLGQGGETSFLALSLARPGSDGVKSLGKRAINHEAED